ncbi:26S proteasome non-ATPase regulatory subunit 9 [Agrilus planipennis]|uniref:26S proteasome non-ATPase regulatory subunit 9 n=1 Tax=Agrilus planipennis TaxID=224129 RepID=A0A1W4WS41_AGRPL|nr:26S proteasome non-ATPase regulatory subunit 9 [Agrilus planipennis]
MSEQIREEILRLMKERDKMEQEIKELSDILTLNGVGMTDPLVDSEGFPVNTIDVYQVRHARHRINCLQNDHKQIMKLIEQGLHGYYSTTSAEGVHSIEDVDMEGRQCTAVEIHKEPFAKIANVLEGSPADLAGLSPNDLLVEFGSVNARNFKCLKDIATVVEHSQGQQIRIKMKRGDAYLSTNLIPRKWQGKGLLGCNIVLLEQ